jgi:mono/diheme cytochrome c family protein
MTPREHKSGNCRRMRWLWVAFLLTPLLASLSGCSAKPVAAASDPLLNAYDVEPDWNNPDHLIPLNYEQAQGKRVFYADCVWCHADSTPAGPSNRANLTPMPALMNDGSQINGLSDQFLQNFIALGGAAVGKSPMMPAWGQTLSPEEIQGVIAFARVIAQPPYPSSAPSNSPATPK